MDVVFECKLIRSEGLSETGVSVSEVRDNGEGAAELADRRVGQEAQVEVGEAQ